MTPEIRAAVRTLAAAFQAILEALAKEETPKPRPPQPAPMTADHEAHLVMKPGGWLDMCCDRHSEEYENNVRRYGQPPQLIDQLGGPERRYISARLGGWPGVGPRR
jgi:hypothetical protein